MSSASAQQSDSEALLLINKTLQDALIWTGHYDGLSDGALGEKSIAGFSAFQREISVPVTGELDPGQKIRLLSAAHAVRKRLGFEVREEPGTRIRLGLPHGIVQHRNAAHNGNRYASADSSVEIIVSAYQAANTPLRTLDESVLADGAMRSVAFKIYRRDGFFVSGERGGKDSHPCWGFYRRP